MRNTQGEPTEQDSDDEPSVFQRFEDFARKLFAVPKREIDEQEAKTGGKP